MRCASVDVGTNTARLLIADVDKTGLIRPVLYRRAITRLGGGYLESKGIDEGAAERAFAALKGFQEAISSSSAEKVFSVATSVVRRAKNRDWFLGEAYKRAGLKITVITGGEEARLSLLGVLSVLDDSRRKKLVMDVGGGSTEFIATSGDDMAGEWSMEMGVLHLTEKYLKSDPPKKEELGGLESEINTVIGGLRERMMSSGVDPAGYTADGDAVFVGTAGTITTLAAIDKGLEVYDRNKINNHTIGKARLREIYAFLTSLTLKEREGVLSIEKGREDLIIPGTAVAILAMEAFGFEELKVSDAGLLEGVILASVSALP